MVVGLQEVSSLKAALLARREMQTQRQQRQQSRNAEVTAHGANIIV